MYDLMRQKNEHDRNWAGLFAMEDSILSSSLSISGYTGLSNQKLITDNEQIDSYSTDNLIKSISHSGYYHTLSQIQTTKTSESQYEALWRLGKWTKRSANDIDKKPPQEKIYHLLERFNRVKVCEIQDVESLEFLEIWEATRNDTKSVFEIWKKRKVPERVLAVRTRLYMSMMKHALDDQGRGMLEEENILDERDQNGSKISLDMIKEHASKHLLFVIDYAISNQNLLLARKTILEYKQLFPNISIEKKVELEYLSIQNEWAQGQKTIAMKFFDTLLQKKHSISSKLETELLNTFGNWSIESKSFRPSIVIEKYLEPATGLEGKQRLIRGIIQCRQIMFRSCKILRLTFS
jgi:hypothetical protein